MDVLVTLKGTAIYCPMRFPFWPASLVILRALACLIFLLRQSACPYLLLIVSCHELSVPCYGQLMSGLPGDVLGVLHNHQHFPQFPYPRSNFIEFLRSNRSHIQTSNRSICLNGSDYQPYVQFACRVLSGQSPLPWCYFS